MADISVYSTDEPAFYDFFGGDSGIYDVIRKLKIAFEERLSLDHYFDVDLTTTDPECDGYHMYVTMQPFSGISSTTGQEILDPEEISDGVILYCKTIDGKPELCFRDQDGCYQITDDGEVCNESIVSSDSKFIGIKKEDYTDNSYVNHGLLNICNYGSLYLAIYQKKDYETIIYKSTNCVDWEYDSTIPMNVQQLICGDRFMAVGITSGGGAVYSSSGDSSWTLVASYSQGVYCIAYYSGEYAYSRVDNSGSTGTSYIDVYNGLSITNVYSCPGRLMSCSKIYWSLSGYNIFIFYGTSWRPSYYFDIQLKLNCGSHEIYDGGTTNINCSGDCWSHAGVINYIFDSSPSLWIHNPSSNANPFILFSGYMIKNMTYLNPYYIAIGYDSSNKPVLIFSASHIFSTYSIIDLSNRFDNWDYFVLSGINFDPDNFLTIYGYTQKTTGGITTYSSIIIKKKYKKIS